MTRLRLTRIALTGASILALSACGGGDPYIDDGEATGPSDQISVTGVISQGQRCLLLTADDGTVYSLAGAQAVSVDHRYEISGLRVEESVCVDGDVAISVSTVVENFTSGSAPEKLEQNPDVRMADALGFESDAQFSRAFKAQFGMTPTEAKRALAANSEAAGEPGEADRRYEIWLRAIGAA